MVCFGSWSSISGEKYIFFAVSEWKCRAVYLYFNIEALNLLNSQVDKDLLGSSEADSTKGSDVAVDGYSLKSETPYAFHIEISDICGVIPCADLSLPHGAGFCIDTVHGLKYLVKNLFTNSSFYKQNLA